VFTKVAVNGSTTSPRAAQGVGLDWTVDLRCAPPRGVLVALRGNLDPLC
jgi:hypothetical protein